MKTPSSTAWGPTYVPAYGSPSGSTHWMSSAKAASAAGMSPAPKHAYACSMISLLVAAIWVPLSVGGRRVSPTEKAFVSLVRGVCSERTASSRAPGDVDPRFVAARDPGDDRLVEVRAEI